MKRKKRDPMLMKTKGSVNRREAGKRGAEGERPQNARLLTHRKKKKLLITQEKVIDGAVQAT